MQLIQLILLIPYVSSDYTTPSLDDVKKGCKVFNAGPCQSSDCPPCWVKTPQGWDCYAYKDPKTKTCTFDTYKDVSSLLDQLKNQPNNNSPQHRSTTTITVYQTMTADFNNNGLSTTSSTTLFRSYLLLVIYLLIMFG